MRLVFLSNGSFAVLFRHIWQSMDHHYNVVGSMLHIERRL